MSPPQTLFLLWLTVTLLAAPVLLYGTWLFMTLGALDAPMFLTQIRKLLSANNRQRAIKLCMAAPDLPVLRLARHALELRLPPSPPVGDSIGGYRDSVGGQPLDSRAREALQIQAVTGMAVIDRWWRRSMIAATPVVLCAVPLLVMREGPLPLVLGGVAVAAALTAFATFRRESIRKGMTLCIDTLAPCVLAVGDSDDDDARVLSE